MSPGMSAMLNASSSETLTRPRLGVSVVNGYGAILGRAPLTAPRSVDFPAFGSPTTPLPQPAAIPGVATAAPLSHQVSQSGVHAAWMTQSAYYQSRHGHHGRRLRALWASPNQQLVLRSPHRMQSYPAGREQSGRCHYARIVACRVQALHRGPPDAV